MKFDLDKSKPNFALIKTILKTGRYQMDGGVSIINTKPYFIKLMFLLPFSLFLKDYVNTKEKGTK